MRYSGRNAQARRGETMNEPMFQLGAIGLFGSILLGNLAIRLLIAWQKRKRRRLARGFRNMRSPAHLQRQRARQPKWAEHHPGRAAAQRGAGWR